MLVVLISMEMMMIYMENYLIELMNIDHEKLDRVERRNEHINQMAVLIQQQAEQHPAILKDVIFI